MNKLNVLGITIEINHFGVDKYLLIITIPMVVDKKIYIPFKQKHIEELHKMTSRYVVGVR